MKNKSLSPIVKASLKSNRVLSAMFCFFVVISYVLIFLAVGIIVPLGVNIETKLNQHILNREITIEISDIVSEEEQRRRLEEIQSIPEVIDVYTKPFPVYVRDESGLVKGEYELGFMHKYYTPEIVGGRSFEEGEDSVALVPSKFQDYDAAEGIIREIDGTSLVGKTLRLKDMTETVREFKVVGAYDTTDPIFSGKEIIMPREELLKINTEFSAAMPDGMYGKGYSAIVVTDSYKSTDEVFARVEKITNSYRLNSRIDVDTYNTAFVILLGSTAFFVLLTVFGFYMFLKGNVSTRTKELALYRAIGYKSMDLYRIILGEHLVLTVVSILLGAVGYYLLVNFAANPYLDSFLGSTFMKMSVSTNPLFALVIALGYAVITLLVSAAAVKRTEKIDLTVLLNRS